MLTILVLVLVAGILAGFLQAIDYEDLRNHPRGLVSMSGMAVVVGGGFVLGFAYGAVTASDEGTLTWLFRGLAVGFMVAAGGAFYLGLQQRRDRRSREEDQD